MFRPLFALALLGTAAGAVPAQQPAYRDLNHNGRLDPYEDARLPVDRRVDDLLGQMTLEEKVGAMLHGTLPTEDSLGRGSNGYDLKATAPLIAERHITSFITRLAMEPRAFAEQNNAVQRLAEQARLGIPVTISSDPRNHFQVVPGASTASPGFAQWPETLGFAALGDIERVRQFGDMTRREYRAVGIHMALSPQADLFTEPRWPRGTGTFGANPALAARMVGAYVAGFQGGTEGVQPDGVATVVKHWVGYGAEPEGFDGHNQYGRIARLDQESFAQHVAAFDDALRFRTAGVMPTYPIIEGVTLDGKPLESVGAGFSKQLLEGLLRTDKEYEGLIVSDWAITNDCPVECSAPTAAKPQSRTSLGMPWGVETLTQQQRFAKGANAGIDQFGGVNDPAPLLAAVRAGQIPAARIDAAVRRVLALKFRLGLFDNPYVDAGATAALRGSPAHALAARTQREAQVVLENRKGAMPLRAGARVWLYRIDPAAARAAGLTVVTNLAEADAAIVRVDTPHETLHPHHFFGNRQNEGRLDFRPGDADYDAIIRAAAAVPTIVAVNLDRPAILTNVRERAAALIGTFGASDAAVIDVVTGKAKPRGKLPFELPSSMAAVAAQDPARPDDSARPLYPFGAGIMLP